MAWHRFNSHGRVMMHKHGSTFCLPWLGAAATALALLAGCNRKPVAEALPSRPLLVNDEPDFRDADEHFRFVPPEKWSMQERSVAAPHFEKDDRTLVKFKNLVTGTTTSWMTVKVVKEPMDVPLAKCLTKRAPGGDFRQVGVIEDIDLKGRPAARIAWKGKFDGHDFIRETVAARRGDRVYLISGVYYATDMASRKLIRESASTCEWDD